MFSLLKRNKRLEVVDENQTTIYVMPDFVQVVLRNDFQKLVDDLNESGYHDIQKIIEFESNPRYRADYREKMKRGKFYENVD
jgi:hypothetical protein